VVAIEKKAATRLPGFVVMRKPKKAKSRMKVDATITFRQTRLTHH
jgi:hypothetical protein